MMDRPLRHRATSWVRTSLCCIAILLALVATTSVFAQERSEGSGEVTQPTVSGKSVLVPGRRAEAPEVRAVLAPPVEDTCAGAQVIPGAGPFPYLTTPVDSTDATVGAPEPTPAAAPCSLPTPVTDFSRGIWFTFTPAVTAPYTFTTCGTVAPGNTLDDTIIGIFTGSSCAGPFTQLGTACNDDAGAACAASGRHSQLAGVVLNAGTTYYIMAWRWDDADGGSPGQTTQLFVDKTPPPPNDTCAGAIALNLNQSRNATLVAAENHYTLDTSGGTACFSGNGQTASTAPGRDAVFSFTAPAAGKYSFKGTSTAAAGNNVVYTTSTCPAAPAAITCDASVHASNRSTTAGNLSGSEEVYCQTMAAGETVYMFMDEANVTGAGGVFYAEVIQCDQEAEPNDTPAQANPTTFQPNEGTVLAGDVDFWSIGAPPAGSRIFAVVDGVSSNPSATTADFDLRVTNATDTLEYDDGDNVSSMGSFTGNIAGRALDGTPTYLKVDYFPGTPGNHEPYRLYYTVQPPGSDPYGSSSTAEVGDAPGPGTLNASQSAGNGYFRGTHLNTTSTNGFDQDTYHFCAAAGEVIQVGIDADPGRNLTPYAPTIFLFNSAGATIVGSVDGNAASNNASGAGNLSSTTPNSPGLQFAYRSPTTGVYYAMLESFGATPPNGNDYLLSIGRNGQPHANDSATITTTLDTDSPTADSGGEIIYVIHIENTGINSSLDADFTFPLPPGVLYDGIAGTGTDGAIILSQPVLGANGTVSARVPCLRAGGFFDYFVFGFAPQCTGDGFELEASVSVTSKTNLTGDSVLSASTSTPINDPGTCDDGQFCTGGDHCESGACVGSFACEDNDPCTLDTCDEENSACSNSFSPGEVCDDGNPCTSAEGDICLDFDPNTGEPGNGCYGLLPYECNDGLNCTADACDGVGGCTADPVDCEDGDACTTNTCDESAGGCVSSPVVCDDGSACTTDTCNSADGCHYDPISCDDGLACTTDTCDAADGCHNTAVVCDDGDACTSDSCSEPSGSCVFDPIPGCGNVCNSTDNPKNLAYWKKLCNRGPQGGDAITAADAACVASQGNVFSSVDEVKDICEALNSNSGISNTCSAANAQLMALALNVCHQRVCDNTAIDANNTDASTVGEAYDEADAALSTPTGNGCFYSKKALAEINGGQALSNFAASTTELDVTTTRPARDLSSGR